VIDKLEGLSRIEYFSRVLDTVMFNVVHQFQVIQGHYTSQLYPGWLDN